MQHLAEDTQRNITADLTELKSRLAVLSPTVLNSGDGIEVVFDGTIRPMITGAENRVEAYLMGDSRANLIAEIKERNITVKGGVSKAKQATLVRYLVPRIMEEGPQFEEYKALRKAVSAVDNRRYRMDEADATLRHWATLVDQVESEHGIFTDIKHAQAFWGRFYLSTLGEGDNPVAEPMDRAGALRRVGQEAINKVLSGDISYVNSASQIRASAMWGTLQSDIAAKQVARVTLSALSQESDSVWFSSTGLVDNSPRGW